MANHMQFDNVNWFCILPGLGSCGDGVGHSYGVNLWSCKFVIYTVQLVIDRVMCAE